MSASLTLAFGKLRVVRALMMIRTGKRPPRKTVSGDLRRRLQGTGFVIVVEVPNQELVMGIAGRFWRPDGGRYMELTADDFTRFVRSGYAKAAWNFRVRTDSGAGTVLATETRIKCFGPGALRAFRMYWSLLGPFSGLMRKAILKKVKTEAELLAKS